MNINNLLIFLIFTNYQNPTSSSTCHCLLPTPTELKAKSKWGLAPSPVTSLMVGTGSLSASLQSHGRCAPQFLPPPFASFQAVSSRRRFKLRSSTTEGKSNAISPEVITRSSSITDISPLSILRILKHKPR